MGGSYEEARSVPLDKFTRFLEFAAQEAEIEKMKADAENA